MFLFIIKHNLLVSDPRQDISFDDEQTIIDLPDFADQNLMNDEMVNLDEYGACLNVRRFSFNQVGE